MGMSRKRGRMRLKGREGGTEGVGGADEAG